jgi:hypothetical protein
MVQNDWEEIEVEIQDIKCLLDRDYDIEISSPDGWVPVTQFVDKGKWLGYKVSFDDKFIIVNENHLFQTKNGWELTKDILGDVEILHESLEYKKCYIEKLEDYFDIVDLQVDHPNHRYYADGLCSHNTNVGKTLLKCHLASHYLRIGKNVLYITLEMSENEIAKRIDANLLNVEMDKLTEMSKEQYIKKRNYIMSKTLGKLMIKEFPTASANVNHFRALLNELRLKKNFVPDIILIDYMNICASSRMKMGASVNSYTYIKSIAEELRGLAVEFNVPLITSSQLNRTGGSNSDPNIEDISESHGTGMTADFIAALINTEELETLNQLMVKQIKSRYGDKSVNKRFVIGIDRAKSKLYDVENSAQQDIIDSGQSESKTMEELYTKSFANKKKSFDGFTV